jgi:hypothetical protein
MIGFILVESSVEVVSVGGSAWAKGVLARRLSSPRVRRRRVDRVRVVR